MESVVYLNLTSKRASATLDGGNFIWPKLTFGEEVTLGMRLAQNREGTPVRVNRTVAEVRATIGRIDARPESGEFKLQIGGDVADLTGALQHNASAPDLRAALTTLAGASAAVLALGDITVEQKAGSYLVRFAAETVAAFPTAPVAIAIADTNSLMPSTFARHRSFQHDEVWVHEIRLIQAPVASTDQSSLRLPPPPVITAVVDGGTESSVTWNEVQALTVPLDFDGSYRIRRGLLATSLLSAADGTTEIADALNANLIDEGGEFIVTNPDDEVAHIEFAGDMGGIDQDLLTIEVFDTPASDLTITLDLGTAEMDAILREQESVVLPIEISADIEDEDDDEIIYSRTLYVGEVEIARELHWNELSTAASVDWLRPPLPERYEPFDLSHVSNGQLHDTTVVGNGAATIFVVDHNLDVGAVQVVVQENSAGGAILINGTDYDVTVDTSNTVTVTSLIGAPASSDWKITVLGLEMTSYFDPHTHDIADVTGLQLLLDTMGTRLSSLENLSGGSALTTNDNDTGRIAEWQFPDMFEAYPARVEIEEAAVKDLRLEDLPRARGLLPAIHDVVVDDLSTILTGVEFPLASTESGNVFVNDGDEIRSPGGKGHRSATIQPGEFVASDGRAWYQVSASNIAPSATTYATTVTDTDTVLVVDHPFVTAGTPVVVDGTPPTPFVADTIYYVYAPVWDVADPEVDDPDGVILSSDGDDLAGSIVTPTASGTMTIAEASRNSYYPTAFERELFALHINEKQLRLRKSMELSFAIELAVVASNTAAQWSVVIEKGEYTEALTPGSPGPNLASVDWDTADPWLEQRVILMPTATTHRFGCRVTRALVDSVDTLTAKRRVYGALEGGLTAPTSANFALRARLVRFDTEDGESDPEGFAVLRGLSLGGGADDDTSDDTSDVSEGTAVIR